MKMSEHHSSTQQPLETNKSIYGDDSFTFKDFAVGTIIGAVIGASLALLFAPKKGEEIRQDVATKATTLKSKGVELSAVAKDKTAQLSQDLKEQSTQLVEKVKTKVAATSEEMEETLQTDSTLEEVAEAIEEVVAELTDTEPDASIEEIKEENK